MTTETPTYRPLYSDVMYVLLGVTMFLMCMGLVVYDVMTTPEPPSPTAMVGWSQGIYAEYDVSSKVQAALTAMEELETEFAPQPVPSILTRQGEKLREAWGELETMAGTGTPIEYIEASSLKGVIDRIMAEGAAYETIFRAVIEDELVDSTLELFNGGIHRAAPRPTYRGDTPFYTLQTAVSQYHSAIAEMNE